MLEKSSPIQPDGKILVAGYTVIGSDSHFALVRYKSDGNLDETFNFDGKVTEPSVSISVAIQPDGKILISGSGENLTFLQVRYNSDGSLDRGFDGVNTLDGAPTFVAHGNPVVLDSNVAIQDAELDAMGAVGSGESITLPRSPLSAKVGPTPKTYFPRPET